MEWLKQQVIAALSGDQKVSRQLLLGLAAVVAVVSLVLVSVNSGNTPKGEFEISESTDSLEAATSFLYVHVIGEVKNPGIYQLPVGARLVDAVFAAGGLTAKADDGSINLARELFDGEQVIVLAIGEQPAAGTGSNNGLISINRASEAELDELPGIGPALASRILAWREANGGFKTKQDLLKVSGIGQSVLSGILDLITL